MEMKIFNLEQMLHIRHQMDVPLIVTNGCFDLLRRGHRECLEAAKKITSNGKLLVLLNSDSSVRENKGPTRPINNQWKRAKKLAALPFVDYVVIFNSKSPRYLIHELKPAHYVKGSEYQNAIDPETHRLLGECGTQIHFIPRKHNKSTTKIIERLAKWKLERIKVDDCACL